MRLLVATFAVLMAFSIVPSAKFLPGFGFVLAQSLPFHADPSAREQPTEFTTASAIRFLATTDYPPFSFRSANGELIGFNIDLAQRICDVLDVVCTIQAWPWEQAADALADNQGDALIAGLAINSANAERFDFSSVYLTLPGRFVTQKSEVLQFDPFELTQTTIAVRLDSNHAEFVRRYVPYGFLVNFETEIEALQAVADGSAGAYFGDALRASFWLSENPACCDFAGEAYFRDDLFGTGMTVTVPTGRNATRRAINWALVRLHDGGTLDELYLRWFPVGFY